MSSMSFSKDLKRAVSVMVSPGSTTRRMMDLEEGFALYYKVALVSVVLFLLVSLVFNGFAALIEVVAFAAFFWIFVPLVIIVQSAILHFVCNFALREFKRGYYETVAAAVYAAMPLLLLSWLLSFPVIGPLLFVIALVWSFFVLIISLSNLQRVSRLSAFVVVILTYIFESIVGIMLGVLLALGIFGIFSNMLGFMHGIVGFKL